ncbi:MAG: hypothetical protein AAFY15_03810 [Cyanobacteria bacterium J06648_11]
MATVSTAVIELRAESARLRSDLDKVTQRVKRFGRRNQSVFNKLARDAQRSFTRVGLSAGAAATGLTALSISAAKAADSLAKTADKLGVGTKQLAGLQLAAKLTGVETTKLNIGLQRLTRRVAEAAQGTGEAQSALRELGLDAKELTQLAPDEQFKRIGEAFGQISNQSDKVRLGFKLFDSEGVDLIRTLELQRSGLEAAQREAEAFGVALSRVEAKQIENAADAIGRARTALSGIGTGIALNASSLIETLAGDFADSAVEAKGFRKEIDSTFRNLAVAAGVARNVVTGVQISLLGAKAALIELKRSTIDDSAVAKFFEQAGDLRAFKFGGGDALTRRVSARIGADDSITQLDKTFARIEALTERFKSPDEIRKFYDASIAEQQGRARAQLDAAGVGVGGQPGEGSPEVTGANYDPDNDPILQAVRQQQEAKKRALDDFLKYSAQKARERQRTELQVERFIQAQKLQTYQLGVQLLQTFGQNSKKAAIAAVLLNKGLAIAQAVQNTALAATKALTIDPTGGLSARVTAAGAAQIGIIAATGIGQIANITRGQNAIGSATNPAFTQSTNTFASSSGFGTAEPQRVVSITVNGDVVGESGERVLRELRELIEDNDEVLFSSESRQALELTGE